ncbi:hypothetical protein F5Y05DRAFT_55189 [Hypoxylon sp. FL0543]|nr:hypothetical protein F5Y05DRAFT_55189 [Hypoxylon sp. FL0543]
MDLPGSFIYFLLRHVESDFGFIFRLFPLYIYLDLSIARVKLPGRRKLALGVWGRLLSCFRLHAYSLLLLLLLPLLLLFTLLYVPFTRHGLHVGWMGGGMDGRMDGKLGRR